MSLCPSPGTSWSDAAQAQVVLLDRQTEDVTPTGLSCPASYPQREQNHCKSPTFSSKEFFFWAGKVIEVLFWLPLSLKKKMQADWSMCESTKRALLHRQKTDSSKPQTTLSLGIYTFLKELIIVLSQKIRDSCLTFLWQLDYPCEPL